MSRLDVIGPHMGQPADVPDVITDTIRTMRTHLGMEIGYLSEFVGDDLVFRAVDAPGLEDLAKIGDARSRSETYCNHILSGALPQLMADTLDYPIAAALPITQAIPIRAHVSVPIERSDGSIYGMFCCLSPQPNKTLNDRDLQLMRSFARLAQSEVQRELEGKSRRQATLDVIHNVVEQQNFKIVYQPIFSLETGDVSGVEALCRFEAEPYRPPNLWFDDAAGVGLGEMLEVCVIEAAIANLHLLPPGAYLSLNASPQTVATGLLAPILQAFPPEVLVVEVTEHIGVSDWATLDRELDKLRDMGIRIAIDDAGAGYAGLQHMVRLRPDIIKLDRSLVDRVDEDPARRSLCAAMVHYATETGAALVAEGIERKEEEDVLRSLGVHLGQGFLLAKPMPLDAFLDAYCPTKSQAHVN
ncbi:sensor domain-containing phosphodiesterase [Jannaschia sp. CCS1]|uniref:sensor domain-containing phosphodiesterase n=1 Tax=Jannaschia sp. (strain CCS1) TaxID=290400 RepID=UPI000053CD84|nr:EAL domain-containing protein [Jannaschia sp. CCS1]ABD55163.1 diguanylate phosphodiesterase [Jannaschia sp. CCS1]